MTFVRKHENMKTIHGKKNKSRNSLKNSGDCPKKKSFCVWANTKTFAKATTLNTLCCRKPCRKNLQETCPLPIFPADFQCVESMKFSHRCRKKGRGLHSLADESSQFPREHHLWMRWWWYWRFGRGRRVRQWWGQWQWRKWGQREYLEEMATTMTMARRTILKLKELSRGKLTTNKTYDDNDN